MHSDPRLTFFGLLANVLVIQGIEAAWSSETLYSCCLAPAKDNPFVDQECGSDGFGWRWSSKQYTNPAQYVVRDYRLTLLLAVWAIVHVPAVPVIYLRCRERRYTEAVAWGGAMFASFGYHLADALRGDVLGMTPQNWMRTTNAYSIVLVSMDLLDAIEHRLVLKLLKSGTSFVKGYYRITILSYARLMLLGVTLALLECWQWWWWKGVGCSLLVSVVIVVALSSWMLRDSVERSQVTKQLLRFPVLFMTALGLILLIRGRNGIYLVYKEGSESRIGNSDLERIWYGSWPLLSVCCLNCVGLGTASLPIEGKTEDHEWLQKLAKYRRRWGWATWVALIVFCVWLPAEPPLDSGRELRWCCVVPPHSSIHSQYDPYKAGGCGSNGWRWKEDRLAVGVAWDSLFVSRGLCFNTLTRLAGLLVVVHHGANSRPFEFAVGLFSTIFGFLYHLGASLESPIFGVAPGNWLRLDHASSVLLFGSQILYIVYSVADRNSMELAQTLFLFSILYTQEMAPLRSMSAIMPTLGCATFTGYHLWNNPSHFRFFVTNPFTFISLLCFIGGGWCLSTWLQSTNQDELVFQIGQGSNVSFRVIHAQLLGGWHVLSGVGSLLSAHAAQSANSRTLEIRRLDQKKNN